MWFKVVKNETTMDSWGHMFGIRSLLDKGCRIESFSEISSRAGFALNYVECVRSEHFAAAIGLRDGRILFLFKGEGYVRINNRGKEGFIYCPR